MMQEKFYKIIIATMLGLNVVLLFVIFQFPFSPGIEEGREHLISRLQLTAEQKEQYTQLDLNFQKNKQQIKREWNSLNRKYLLHIKLGHKDGKEYYALKEALSRVNYQRDSLVYDHFLKVRSICDPEQQKRFEELIDEIAINAQD